MKLYRSMYFAFFMSFLQLFSNQYGKHKFLVLVLFKNYSCSLNLLFFVLSMFFKKKKKKKPKEFFMFFMFLLFLGI